MAEIKGHQDNRREDRDAPRAQAGASSSREESFDALKTSAQHLRPEVDAGCESSDGEGPEPVFDVSGGSHEERYGAPTARAVKNARACEAIIETSQEDN